VAEIRHAFACAGPVRLLRSGEHLQRDASSRFDRFLGGAPLAF
jgi:hypothetical protein